MNKSTEYKDDSRCSSQGLERRDGGYYFIILDLVKVKWSFSPVSQSLWGGEFFGGVLLAEETR